MSDAAMGEIRMFAGNYAPENWVLCNGAMLSVQQYQALFSLIGKAFGGDGVNTFGVPDLRGRLPICQGQGKQSAVNYALGQAAGSETVTLTDANTPSHTHAFFASGAAANTQTPTNAMLAVVTANGTTTGLYGPTTGSTSVAMDPNFMDFSYGASNGAAPHPNMMQSLCINFIVCVNGLYPPQQ